MPTGDTPVCAGCHPPSVMIYPCPVHAPDGLSMSGSVAAGGALPFVPWSKEQDMRESWAQPQVPRLSDDDVERIAQRVAEIMRGEMEQIARRVKGGG